MELVGGSHAVSNVLLEPAWLLFLVYDEEFGLGPVTGAGGVDHLLNIGCCLLGVLGRNSDTCRGVHVVRLPAILRVRLWSLE